MIEWAAYTLCGVGIVLPTIPALVQLRFPRNEPVKIDQQYAREPRYLGRSFRSTIDPVLNGGVTGRLPFLKRQNEFALIDAEITIPDGATVRDVLLSRGALRTGTRATLLDAYARGEVRIGAHSTLRTLASDADTTIAARSTVERWIDVEGDLRAGEYCDLGVSASATGRLTLERGTRFHRLYASPVSVAAGTGAPSPRKHAEARGSTVVIKAGSTSIGDLIAARDVVVGERAAVSGTITSGGDIYVGAGARIDGSLIARGDIILGNGTSVAKYLFADRTIEIGAQCVIGTAESPITVQSTETLHLGPGTTIFGWVICERGGTTAGIEA